MTLIPIDECLAVYARSRVEELRYRPGRPWHAKPRYSIFMGRGTVLNADGSVDHELDWVENALTLDGQADIIGQYLKNSPAVRASYNLGLTLVSTATTNLPSVTTHATDLTQTALAGTTTVTEQNTGDGYARQNVVAAGWAANTQPGGNTTQTASPQVTFGPAATAAWTGTTTSPGQIQHAIVSSATSGTTGVLVLFLALSATTSVALTQSFAYTLNFKVA